MIPKDTTRMIGLIFVLGVFLTNGCATWRSFSKPHIEDNNEWILSFKENNFEGYLKGNDIKIWVNPINDGASTGVTILPIPLIPLGTWAHPPESEVFEIAILLRTKNSTYRFNPSKIELRMSESIVLQPAYYRVGKKGNGCFGRYHNPFEMENLSKIEDLALEIDDTCVNLLFTVPAPPPEKEFEVIISGLSKNNVAMQFPVIFFKPGTMPSGW